MYKNFVSETDASLFTAGNRTSTPAITVSDDEEYFDIDNTNIVTNLSISVNDSVKTAAVSEVSKVNQLSNIMEKIHSLQKQLSELTTQVNTIVQETYGTNKSQPVKVKQSYTSVVQETIELSDSNEPLNANTSNPRTPSSVKKHTKRHAKTDQDPKTIQSSATKGARFKDRTTAKEISHNGSSTGGQSNNKSSNVLIIGDSILHGINIKGLIRNVHKHAASGAKIDSILDDIKMFDLKTFSTVIIYIGGNDVASGSDLELYEEKYDKLLRYVKMQNSMCKVTLCSICPREDVDDYEMCQLNDIIHGLAREHGHKLADMYSAFHEKDGNVCERFYQYDSIHINPSGIKRFMRVLHDTDDIVQDFDRCNFPKRGRYQGSFRRQAGRNRNNGILNCMKCGESNHETRFCRHKNQLKCRDCHFYGHKSSLCINNV